MVDSLAAARQTIRVSRSATRFKRSLLTVAGVLCVGLAVAGIFLPLLPTTPLLLLAAGCFARGSPRLERRLMNHPTLGRYIRDYRQGRGMPLRAKITALVLLWTTIGASALLAVEAWWIRLLLGVVAVCVTAHLLRIKTSDGKTKSKGPVQG